MINKFCGEELTNAFVWVILGKVKDFTCERCVPYE